jgi:hypothetical protein
MVVSRMSSDVPGQLAQCCYVPFTTSTIVGAHCGMDCPKPVEQTLRCQLTAFAQFTTRSLDESNIDSPMLDACLRSRAGLNVSHAKLVFFSISRDRPARN